MKVSAKARYSLAAMALFAAQYRNKNKFSVLEISEELEISKIYLEQVFAQLKLAGLVQSTKGPQGGYSLTRAPEEITVLEILAATETGLFDPNPATVEKSAPHIESAMQSLVFGPLDAAVRETLGGVTLQELSEKAQAAATDGYMYYL